MEDAQGILAKHRTTDPANHEDRTHPVAQLKPNNFGLFDMLGSHH
ncbi:MAG: hypothetical protein R3C28_11750 [Pirellulaceae bacterium]